MTKVYKVPERILSYGEIEDLKRRQEIAKKTGAAYRHYRPNLHKKSNFNPDFSYGAMMDRARIIMRDE